VQLGSYPDDVPRTKIVGIQGFKPEDFANPPNPAVPGPLAARRNAVEAKVGGTFSSEELESLWPRASDAYWNDRDREEKHLLLFP